MEGGGGREDGAGTRIPFNYFPAAPPIASPARSNRGYYLPTTNEQSRDNRGRSGADEVRRPSLWTSSPPHRSSLRISHSMGAVSLIVFNELSVVLASKFLHHAEWQSPIPPQLCRRIDIETIYIHSPSIPDRRYARRSRRGAAKQSP